MFKQHSAVILLYTIVIIFGGMVVLEMSRYKNKHNNLGMFNQKECITKEKFTNAHLEEWEEYQNINENSILMVDKVGKNKYKTVNINDGVVYSVPFDEALKYEKVECLKDPIDPPKEKWSRYEIETDILKDAYKKGHMKVYFNMVKIMNGETPIFSKDALAEMNFLVIDNLAEINPFKKDAKKKYFIELRIKYEPNFNFGNKNTKKKRKTYH